MKDLKVVGLLIVAVASMMAFATNASAVVLTSPSGTAYTGELTLSMSETATLKASVFTETCTVGEINATISTNTTVASGAVTKFHSTSCDSTELNLANGSIEVKESGEVFLRGNEQTTSKIGVSCIYGGGTGTKIGTLDPGTTATLTVSASLPKLPGSGTLCAGNAAWTGKYKVTSPDTLLLN